jgi:hypothetical protein
MTKYTKNPKKYTKLLVSSVYDIKIALRMQCKAKTTAIPVGIAMIFNVAMHDAKQF